MATIEEIFLGELRRKDPLKALKKAIVKNEKAILDINRKQMDRGETAQGTSIGQYKNLNYKGRREPVDLLLEGPFRAEMYLEVDDTKTEFNSSNKKTPWLAKKYKKERIFGISTPGIPVVGEIIKEDFQKEYVSQ